MELALNKNNDDLTKAISFYDFIILNPPQDYYYLIEKNVVENKDVLLDAISRIITESKRQNKIVIASSDPVYIDPEDQQYWKIYIETKRLGGKPHPLKDFKNELKHYLTNISKLQMN